MAARFGASVLRRRGPLEDTFDALGRKAELHQSDAAIEDLAIMRDQSALDPVPGKIARVDRV